MRKINLLIILSFILVSCGSLKEAGKMLRNEKITTTDEFLVEKKQPLVLPPNYEKIPEPGSMKASQLNDEDKIKKLLKAPKEDIIKNKSSSTEDSILNKIRK
ncbi:DUF3035 domain-containing protein [Pelagibacteraceae bacterium]|nr:DUF3035 domain-containing protein [Pelagibacteraceae bacterium]|tara:strand:+ start:156 stop:461 length:306 start_codon:yes stop_codon:yes gene_type:complete